MSHLLASENSDFYIHSASTSKSLKKVSVTVARWRANFKCSLSSYSLSPLCLLSVPVSQGKVGRFLGPFWLVNWARVISWQSPQNPPELRKVKHMESKQRQPSPIAHRPSPSLPLHHSSFPLLLFLLSLFFSFSFSLSLLSPLKGMTLHYNLWLF